MAGIDEQPKTQQALARRVSLLELVAGKYSMEPKPFLETITRTIFPGDKPATNEQVAAFLSVANQYGLNPFTREIFAFPAKGGGITPIVSIDGWLKIINEHPSYDGMEIAEIEDDKGNLKAVVCTIYRKDRTHHTPVKARMNEYRRDTEPWRNMPSVMLAHKAIKLAARYTMGFAGIYDEDEAREINITSQSVEIERTTNSRTDALKERLAASQGDKADRAQSAKSAEPAPEAIASPAGSAALPETPTPKPAPKPKPPAPAKEEKPPAPVAPPPPFEDDMGDMLEPNEKPIDDRIVTDEERVGFLKIVKERPGETEKKQRAVREKIFSLGITNTKEIRISMLKPLTEWAESLTV